MIDTAAPPYAVTPQMLVIADDPAAAQLVSEAAVLAGGRIEATLTWAEVPTRVAGYRAIDVIVVEATGIADEALVMALPVLDAIALDRGSRIVVTLTENQIDLIAATIFGAHIQLLCQPTIAERVLALTIATRGRSGGWITESSHNEDDVRLRRLNEEVARIAETLARLTRSDNSTSPDRPSPTVGDRKPGYGAQPPDEVLVSAPEVRAAIRARRMRGQYFDAGLFEDPAWDMLLDLYAAELERAQVSVSSLCIAAAVAPTTALRWIAKMTEAGLLERRADPFDRRRAFMVLSDASRTSMAAYCAAVKRAGLPIA